VGRRGPAVDAIGRQGMSCSPYPNTLAFRRPINEKISEHSKAWKNGSICLPENVMLADAPVVFANVEVPS